MPAKTAGEMTTPVLEDDAPTPDELHEELKEQTALAAKRAREAREERAAQPPEPAEEAKPRRRSSGLRTSLKAVVYRSTSETGHVGQFLTQTVLNDISVTLEEGIETELPADVADALCALSSEAFTITPAEQE